VVEHSPQHLKLEGSITTSSVADTGGEKIVKKL
jgi:hypothetical protein